MDLKPLAAGEAKPEKSAAAMSLYHRFTATVVIGLVVLLAAGPAAADSTRVSFVLVNDIYLMSDQAGPDGQRRGGFARLAALVKAERAKGGHVVVAHAGDTLSPSLMSGLDRGAHIITLSNMVGLDIFVPGNHEFDFGKATFLQRMAEAKFPLYAANLRGPQGQALPGFKDHAIVTFDGVRIGLTGATYDDSARASTPEDLQFLPTVATSKEQAEALRREGADFVVSVVHADRRQDYALFATRTIDLLLTGHDHDLFLNFDGRNAMVESSFNALYVTVVDVSIDVKVQNGRREVSWWPQFRVIDTATVTPDPEVTAVVAQFEQQLSREMDVPLATTAVTLDSRDATLRTGEAAIGNVIADAMRQSAQADVAIMNGGGIRGTQVYPAGATISRRDVLSELPFNNHVVKIEVGGAALREAIENGLSQLPHAAGRFPQVSGLTIEADGSRPPGSRVVSIKVGGEPLDEARRYSVATNDFMARGGDGYDMFRDAPRLLPDLDAPPLANEVMVYLRRLGTVRTDVEGRMVVR
jgi:2',3'-cyclic-nucleotide 2'-phosphodiesterase (5'-nucleotidase family)